MEYNENVILEKEPMFAIGARAFFSTTQSDMTHLNGQEVTIRRVLSDDECDIEDVGFMYEVEIYGGNLIQVFEDELQG